MSSSPDPGSSDPGAWWSDRVFYEVFVRSFADSDGDGIGDLEGLTGRLDDLNDGDPLTTTDLGVTGLWLMPVMASPSYHGYDVTDYRAVNPDYGTAGDFRALVDAAHARGMAVIVDVPINHTSSRHPWFVASAAREPDRADWYVWSDTAPGGPGWHSSGTRWYFGLFGDGLPDLNLENAAVTAEVTDIARFWLGEMGTDGLRLDAAKHLVETDGVTENTEATRDWLRSFSTAVHATDPEALLVGEVWDLSQVSASYVPSDLDMTFEFGLAQATIDSLRAGSATRLATALSDVAGLERPDGFGSFLTNHDQDRIASQLDGDLATLKLGADLLLTGPGTPFVYYGEEIGLTGRKPDEQIRTPMPWDGSAPAGGFTTGTPWEPLADGWEAVNVAAERNDAGSLLARYRDMIRLRGDHPALRRGSIVPVRSDADAVLATIRVDPAETLLILANLSDEPVSDYALELAVGPLCGALQAALIDGTGRPAAPTITADGGFGAYRPLPELPPRSVSVVALTP
ncbi:MAG: alpha-amylase family glycosyl hydrolase [Candidatus Limnocylindrales bacterium]